MSKKFKIAQNPTFKSKVKIPRVGGETIEVEFEFKYYPRKELAKLFDKWAVESEKLFKDLPEEAQYSELVEKQEQLQVNQIKDVAIGWEFEDEFTDENIASLVDTGQAVVDAVMDAYNTAYQKAKSGN
jgi:hypothetical protein